MYCVSLFVISCNSDDYLFLGGDFNAQVGSQVGQKPPGTSSCLIFIRNVRVRSVYLHFNISPLQDKPAGRYSSGNSG